MRKEHARGRSDQRGAVTLIVTLLIMIALTLGSFGMVQTSMIESRMTANDQRSREAFQAAQSGIDFVLAALANTPVDSGLVCAPSTWEDYDFELNFQGPMLVEDEDGNTSVVFSFDAATQEAACNSIAFDIITRMNVWSRGYSDDGSSVRTLASIIDLSAPWSFIPPLSPDNLLGGGSPLVARGRGTFRGTSQVARCTTESGPYRCADLDSTGNNPGLIEGDLATLGGAKDIRGNPPHQDSIIENDPVRDMTTDAFFEEYMGETKADFLASEGLCTLGVDGDCSGAQVIYAPEGLTLSGTARYGSEDNPVRFFVEGELKLTGGATIWGVVYTEDTRFTAGTNKIFGQLLVEREVDMRGNASVYGNPDLVRGPPELAVPPETLAQFSEARKSFLRLGSWREVRSGI